MHLNFYNSKVSYVAEESNDFNDLPSSYSDSKKERDVKFKFPPAPRFSNSTSVSPCSAIYNSASESSLSDTKLSTGKRRSKRKNARSLPPIGVFWDIENCQVPRTKSATLVVQQIRELFYNDYREAEFLVVCDVKKESSQIISDLNDAQVNLIHVSSISKNAADEKLRQSLRRFSDLHKAPAAVALISGDVNFASDLSDLRYRKKMYVILLHNNNVADALILCANKTYNFTSITERVPPISKVKPAVNQQTDLLVFNLPFIGNNDTGRLKNRLKLLSDNCGGRVLAIHRDSGYAVIRFSTNDFAKRAQKRLDGEDVFGNRIQVSQPIFPRESLLKNYTGRKIRNDDSSSVPTINTNQSYGKSEISNNVYTKNNSWTTEPKEDLSNLHFGNLQSTITNPSFFLSVDENVPHLADGKCYQTGSKNGDIKSKPIELIISNLDSSIDVKELWNILLNKLKQYVMVLNFSINIQTDGSPVAVVKVATHQEAQLVISQLHHQRLGGKHISICSVQPKSDSDQLRFIVIVLLQEAPNHRMPLFKFLELAESRYHCNISLSEVRKLKDVCKITEGQGGRMIYLTTEAIISWPLHMQSSVSLQSYCTFHCPKGPEDRGWGEPLEFSLPNIKISLKLFASKVDKLLHTHLGCLPLLSFPVCYAVEFGLPLPEDESGVPLEHLVTCLPKIELTSNDLNKNIKYIKLMDSKNATVKEDTLVKSVSPSSMSNISMFGRDVVDLLKTVDNCQLLMQRYIPTYHHHFGRQCRVADYGFTRLVDVFDAVSHIVQILGCGSNRIVTLTHSAQMRRFTSDLLRLLKSQVSKRIAIENFSTAYEKTFNKVFNPVNYGLCSLEDLLGEIPEGIVIITKIDNLETITIPKREQTVDEIQKTKQFALEVKQLLSHAPYCSMLFNKFVPYYHHHFGRQCKVSDYGFTKLVELFETISDTVDLEGYSDVDRRVKLKLPLALEVLGTQIQTLVKESNYPALYGEEVFAIFKQTYGYPLNPKAYNCNNFTELVNKLNDFVQVIPGSGTGTLLAVNDVDIHTLRIRVWTLLLNPPHMSSIIKFIFDYRVRFHGTLPITKLEQLKPVIVMSNHDTETIVFLTPNYVLAARLYHLLFANGGSILLTDIASIYLRKFGIALCPSDYGKNSLEDLFLQISFVVTVRGRGKQLSVALNKNLADFAIELPSSFAKEDYAGCQEPFSWPAPATHFLYNNFCCFTQTKSDTPSSQDGWSNFHNKNASDAKSLHTTSVDNDNLNFSSHLRCTNATIPKISSPHPTNLPTPDKLIIQDDSGVNSSQNDCTISHNEMFLGENEQININASPQPGNISKIMFNFNM